MNGGSTFGSLVARSQRMVWETALVFAGAMILPFLVHLAPQSGQTPIGAVWLPMFYAPLIAALLDKPQAGFIAGVLAPVVNGLMTGQPEGLLMWTLSFEIGLFVLAAYAIGRSRRAVRWAWAAGLGGYVIAKVGAYLLFSTLGQTGDVNFTAMVNAWPGMLIFLILGYVTIKWRENRY